MAKAFDVDTGGTLETSLQAWYNVESDGTDEFSTNDLTNNNSVGFSTGKIGNAADGGASNSNKNLAIASSLNIDGGVCSLSAWVNVTTAPTSGNLMTFLSQGNSTSKVRYKIDYYNNSGTLQIRWIRDRTGISAAIVTENFTLVTGTWYHLVLTYNATSVEGFRNGSSKGTSAGSGNGNSLSATNFTLLSTENGSEYFSGLIDLAGVLTKQLASQEITDLYNSGTGNAYRTQTVAGGSTFVPRVIMF